MFFETGCLIVIIAGVLLICFMMGMLILGKKINDPNDPNFNRIKFWFINFSGSSKMMLFVLAAILMLVPLKFNSDYSNKKPDMSNYLTRDTVQKYYILKDSLNIVFRGSVVDLNSEYNPGVIIRVKINNKEAKPCTTDNQGYFDLSLNPFDNYEIEWRKKGYAPANLHIKKNDYFLSALPLTIAKKSE